MKMEAVEESTIHNNSFENEKNSEVTDINSSLSTNIEENQKTNGIEDAESDLLPKCLSVNTETVTIVDNITPNRKNSIETTETASVSKISIEEDKVANDDVSSTHVDEVSINQTQSEPNDAIVDNKNLEISICTAEEIQELNTIEIDINNMEQQILETSVPTSITAESVHFETEILIEQEEEVIATDNVIDATDNMIDTTDNVIDTTDNVIDTMHNVIDTMHNVIDTTDNDRDIHDDSDSAIKIFSQLEGQNIDLSEALRSSHDETDNCENNNELNKQEPLTKEQLLEILEGNDSNDKYKLEEVLAVQQLTQLKSKKKQRKINSNIRLNLIKKPKPQKKQSKKNITQTKLLKSENIVKVLVKDWDEDDGGVDNEDVTKKEASNNDLSIKRDEEIIEQNSTDSSCNQSGSHNTEVIHHKNIDDAVSKRRAGRVIKKKVIFDPDNPDTFTKGKSSIKIKQSQSETEETPPKKNKRDTETPPQKIKRDPETPPKKTKRDPDTPPKKNKGDPDMQRAKSKSPISKMLWKKPQLKNRNQYRRLTEVDKLLMDEGAVNMIYQLTPEATKGQKNMETKAALIKKINESSTPETKEMKFRERRKDTPEAKKIIGSKRSSVKSISDDFKAHSADDSIIYRRHSSSSYSSTCMSPRRLSDVDTSSIQNSRQSNTDCQQSTDKSDIGTENQLSDIFMAENSHVSEVIDKKVCQNLKEKLNSKLSRVLNMKRKSEGKVDKPPKQRKSSFKVTTDDAELIPNFKKICVTFNNNVAEITIKLTGSRKNYDIKTLQELEMALSYINNRKNVSITLFILENDTLCTGLDLQSLLHDDFEERREKAVNIVESFRSFLQALNNHSKLLVTGVADSCEGIALTILVLCDMAVASERTMFALSPAEHTLMTPGTSVLMTHSSAFPNQLVQDMLITGRQLSANEALQRGLITRTLWANRFLVELRAMVQEIATQPVHNLLLKKKILQLKRREAQSTFLSCLEAETDLFVEHWTSDEGQEMLRNIQATI